MGFMRKKGGFMGKIHQEEEIQIDLLEVFYILKKRILWILLAGILGAAVFGGVSKYMIAPKYSSSAMLYILSKETTLTSLADLQIGSQLTKDYKVIITSRPVLEEVIQKMKLDINYKTLRNMIEIGNPIDTRVLTITITDSDPTRAKQIVDQLSNSASSYISDIMEMVPPKLIEEGEITINKVSPSNTKNAAIGGLLGILIVCGISVMQLILNDTIQTEEDITKYLGVSILASLPEWSNDKKAKKQRR